MTCIVGLVENGTIYMGADSAGVEFDSLAIVCRADEKIFIHDSGDFIMGFCGSFRVGQLLRYALNPPDQGARKEDMAYMVTDFVDAVRQIQREKGAITKENELEEINSSFIVGYNGSIYVIESDFQVGRPIENYASVGCGSQIAFGAMYATKNALMPPKERIELALSAAEQYCAGVRAPFHILSLEPEGE